MTVFTLAAENRTTVINLAISDIRKQGSEAINKDLFNVYVNNYFKGISSVFNDIDSNSPLWEKVQQYKLNAANFAAHKSYMVTDKIRAAKDDAEIKSIVNKFNRYQSAEYNTIVARSRTAKQWDTFESEKHLFPNLEWIRTRSANPRELHLGYVGIILPMNDAFWQQNQPGNLWNCKCDWKTTDAQTTAKPTKITPAATGLDGNPYETGKLITEKHPYFKVSADEKTIIDKFLVKQIRDDAVKYACDNLRDKKIPNVIGTGRTKIRNINIEFSRKGIEHFAHDFHENLNYKNLLIKNLDELVLKSEYVASAPNLDINNTIVKQYHYYKINILGKIYYLNVRELCDGKFILYSIKQNIKSI